MAEDISHKALLEWARDNRVLRLKTADIEVEFLQLGESSAPGPELTPEQKKKLEDDILFHSSGG